MVRESYDWWTLIVCLPHSRERMERLKPFREILVEDDCGISVDRLKAKKIRVTINARLDESAPWIDDMADAGHGRSEWEQDDEPSENESSAFSCFVPRLMKLRQDLLAGKTAGLQLLASRFDPENWKPPARAPKAAQWIARCIEM